MAWYSIKSVSLSPLHFKWATTRMRLRASLHCVFSTLMCFLNERCESHHSPRNFVDSSTGRSVFPILTMGGLWARDLDAVKWMTLHLWAAKLKPFLVAHSYMAFTACCKCLFMVSRERPRKQIMDKECFEDVLGNTRGQLINVQSKTCHSQDITSWNTLLWVEFVRECCPNSDLESPVPEIFWHKNRQSASEANPVKVSDDAILPGCPIGFLQIKEETNCLLPLNKGIPEISFKAHQVVGCAMIISETTLVSLVSCNFSRYQIKRALIMRSRTLHRQLVSAMGRELSGSVWSLFGLGIGITVAAQKLILIVYIYIYSVYTYIDYKENIYIHNLSIWYYAGFVLTNPVLKLR